jgi:hypothetical protein
VDAGIEVAGGHEALEVGAITTTMALFVAEWCGTEAT